MMKKIILFLLSTLIFFPETSLDSSLAIEKNSLYSIYLYRLLGLTISDWVILALSLIIFTSMILTWKIYLGIVKPLLQVYVFYLMLGLIFNVTVNYDLKSYLYDLKVTLYIFIPYLSLTIINYRVNYFNNTIVKKVLVLIILGAVLDAIYISYKGGAEYSSAYGMPLILALAPLKLLVGIFYYLKIKKISFPIMMFEILSTISRTSLGNLFWGIVSTVWIFLLSINLKFRSKVFLLVSSYYVLIVIVPTSIILVFNDLVPVKKTGVEIRKVEITNFIENSKQNIPIIIGKGLGTTWKKFQVSEKSNVYSEGHLLNSEYNFIWHNTLAGTFYKFGILGSLFLIIYLSIVSVRVYKISKLKQNNFGMFVAFSIPTFVMLNINGPGILKGALLSSLLLYAADQLLKRRTNNI